MSYTMLASIGKLNEALDKCLFLVYVKWDNDDGAVYPLPLSNTPNNWTLRWNAPISGDLYLLLQSLDYKPFPASSNYNRVKQFKYVYIPHGVTVGLQGQNNLDLKAMTYDQAKNILNLKD